MILRPTPRNHGICPLTLARKLALLRIDQQNIRHGVTRSYYYVVNDFRNAIIERKSHEEAVDIIIHYADQLHRCGRLEEVKRLYRKAAEDLGQNFGRHHSSTFFVTFERGRLLQHVRQFQTAERMYNRVLRGMKHRNPYQLYFSNELGVVYADQHELLKAERAFQKALHGFTELWGADHLWAYTAAINLSNIYQTQGKLKEATILLHRGLSCLTKEFGVSHAVIMAAPKFVKYIDNSMHINNWTAHENSVNWP
ncbi:kinesin light chain-like protein [Metarhizium robertsii]|uniref:F-box domain, cyclin-like protein n=2 Tax=Metarhizium robertsii TaxID=568076 RepID=A0A0B2XDT3_METRA|nr:F-box domain, cyclin-like protein [Metarhizium robertsii ARSEF 23]EXU95775.1 kinesin light chain-like protein [Metarhizium robertsii]KHO10915.1 F-box domain, cyclin-like protein [Metarhizium robertsii ARSEF 23]